MAAENLEYTVEQVSVTKGTNLTDQVLATINGAIKEVQIKKVERIGDVTTYTIIIIHDDGTPINLEWTKREITVTKGTNVEDQALATVAGLTQAVDIDLLEQNGTTYIYTVLAVHLNA
jgi:hypothetical protein